MSEVGSGQVAIYPVFKGFRKAVAREVDGSAKSSAKGFGAIFGKGSSSAGRSAGKGFKDAFASGSKGTAEAAVKKLKSEVAVATRALSTARLKQQDALGRVRVAEAALNDVRSKGLAGSARAVAAEERLASANRVLAREQDTTRTSSLKLEDSKNKLAAANKDLDTATSNLAKNAGKRGSGFGARLGSGIVSGFRAAIGPLLALTAGYLGLQGIETVVRQFTGFITDSIAAIGNWQVLNAQSYAVVKSTGGAARVTAGHIHDLSQSIEDQTATEAELIQNGANIIATFKGIRNGARKNNKIYDMTVRSAVDMARALGTDVPTAAMSLGKALNDPVKGMAKLQRQGVTFTDKQKAQVTALVKSGQTMKAQKVILKELNSEFGGSGAAYLDTLPGKLARLKDSYGDIGERIAGGLAPALGRFGDLITTTLGKLEKSGALKSFTTTLSKFADIAADKFGKVVDLFSTLGKSKDGITLEGVSKGLGGIFPSLKPLFDNLPALVGFTGDFLDMMGALTAVLIPALRGIGDLLTPTVQFFADFFKMLKSLVEYFSGAKSPKQYLADFFDNRSYGPPAKKFFETIRGIRQGISGVLTKVGEFVSGVRTKAGEAVGFMASLPGRAVGALGSLGNTLVQAGKDLIGGFVQGIKDSVGGVGKTMTGVMSFIEGFFPHSPAKRGPFSGSGWGRVKQSGATTIGQFAAGFDGAAVQSKIAASLSLAGSTPMGRSSSSSSSDGSSPAVAAAGAKFEVHMHNPIARDPVREGRDAGALLVAMAGLAGVG